MYNRIGMPTFRYGKKTGTCSLPTLPFCTASLDDEGASLLATQLVFNHHISPFSRRPRLSVAAASPAAKNPGRKRKAHMSCNDDDVVPAHNIPLSTVLSAPTSGPRHAPEKPSHPLHEGGPSRLWRR